MSRTRRTFTLVCLAGLLVTGCSAGGPANTAAGTAAIAGSNGADAKAPSVNQPGGGQSGANQSAGGQTSLPPADNGRQVVRTANINVTTDHVGDTVAKIRTAATGAGGYSSDENSSDDHGSLTLKVPADKLDPVLKTIGSYGKVTSQSEHAEDVTDQMVDVTSRLATQRASVDRVRALMDKATSLSDITQIEGELTKREADLESLEQRHDALAAQVAMSTITVDVSRTATPPAPVEDQATFLSALGAGWHALVATVNGLGVGLGAVLPFLLVIGIPAGAVYAYLRQRKARSQPAP